MKKHVISLMMVLALMVLAGTSAFAQNATNETENTTTARFVMLTGSTHTFKVGATTAGNTVAWGVFDEADDGAGTASDGSAGGSTDITTSATQSTVVSTTGDADDAALSFAVTWAESASGKYYIQVTETNAAARNSCSTVRRFFVTLLDFDVLVYASDAAGAEFTDGELADCGEGTVANYGNVRTGEAFDNQFGGVDNDGDLISYTGLAADANGAHTTLTTRYFSIAVVWNSNIDSDDIPTIGSLGFNYTATVNHDLVQVNGTNPSATSGDATGTSYVVDSHLTNPDAADRPTGLTNTAYTVIYTIPVTFNDRWYSSTVADITAYLYANNLSIYSGVDGATGLLGTEPSAKLVAPAGLVNTSATQTINLSPATSTISVD